MNAGHHNVGQKISGFENLADWCAWLVVLGLVLEVALAAGISDSAIVNKWGLVGSDALVALGVAGEILFSRKARILSEERQQLSNKQVAAANERASIADARVQEAKVELAQTQKWLVKNSALVAEALRANAQAVRGTLISAELTKVATERTALAQGLVSPEVVSEAARCGRIIPKIRPFSGKQFDATAEPSTVELEVLLASLRHVLLGVGWVEVGRGNASLTDLTGPTQTGDRTGGSIRVGVAESRISELWEAAQALASALNAEGIEAVIVTAPPDDTSNANAIRILVTAKARIG